MEHNSISMSYAQIWVKGLKVLKLKMISSNSMFAEILARIVLEPKHKHALQKAT